MGYICTSMSKKVFCGHFGVVLNFWKIFWPIK
jgi:hypothetical protein